MAVKWDAVDYARSSAGQQQWARELIAKLHLRGDESLLDIGSGDGKVTAEIACKLEHGSVLGVDNSPEMVALAQTTFPRDAYPNLDFRLADAAELPFEADFDVVFSNATLHWISDPRPVVRGIERSLKNGGKILLQMGGQGNAADVVAAMDEVRGDLEWKDYFDGFEFPYGFYGAGEYCRWLCEAGLICGRVELLPKEMVHPSREAFAGWLRTTWMPYTQRVPQERRQRFIEAVVEKYLQKHPAPADGAVHVQMVRLEVESRKE